MRISDWSSDVCSSDLARLLQPAPGRSERGLSETLQDWIDTEYRYAARAMLRSVSRVDLVKSRPGFAQNIRPRAGSIIASPVLASYDPDPDYFFHWYRDSAVVIAALRVLCADGSIAPEARTHFADFIAFSRSEEHTSELQSLMRISYAVFCLKKKKKQ